ncbi:MAG: DUF3795 domain-containing protein [Pirellulales bacterium]|nr:DUF3795 domain-containing protein [Pirellulales bacterium]
MNEIVADPVLVARCGLYCGACGAYLRGRCPGCRENHKATWCKVRSCCQDNQYATCADCKVHQNPQDCRWFNNWIAKVFGFIFRSNRAACIRQIRSIGIEGHAAEMARSKRQSIKR